jgi:predicted nucleotidyltransferase
MSGRLSMPGVASGDARTWSPARYNPGMISDDRRAVPASGPAPLRSAIEAAVEAWRTSLGPRLVSIVLFGSLARGEAGEESDIDVLVVAADFPWSLAARRRILLAEWERIRAERQLAAVTWNLVTKSPEEARYHGPLYWTWSATRSCCSIGMGSSSQSSTSCGPGCARSAAGA